ncbi:MAG: integrase arm-type DNA-binding domain-containing protein [Gammaproteobacteria bacterium]
MHLSDTRIRNAKASEKPYKLRDGGGLYLEVRPNGAKLWRLRYRLAGKENVYAIGPYPEKGLAEAREERTAAKKLIKKGINPARHRKLERLRNENEHANTFETVAREWLANNADYWTAKTYQQRERILKRDIFPEIGALPLRQVTSAHVLSIVQRIEKRAPSMAVIGKQAIGAICRHGISTLRTEHDPTQPIQGSLKRRKVQHSMPLSRAELADLINSLDRYPGHYSNRIALRLMLLTLARTSEVLRAKWDEFDFEQLQWTIPAERMKMRDHHLVPLPSQAIETLNNLKVVTGNSPYLFPNRSNYHKPCSHGVLWKMIASMGYKERFSPHGIRSTGSTILNETGFRPDVIERQLAHTERNKVRASYNQANYLEERRRMMQWWADYLDTLKAGDTKVVAMKSCGSKG